MLTSLALLAALTMVPSQPGGLTLTDARVTYGILGPTRQNTKYLPGDTLSLSFTIGGITADPNGKVLYSIATQVTDSTGKVVFTQPPQDREAINGLGGDQLPAFAQVAIGLQQTPGEHTLKVTVTDRANKQSQSLSQKFEILRPDFGVVRLTGSTDADAQVSVGLPCVGQSLWISGAVVGFQRGADKQPNVTLELSVMGEDGKPVLAKPFSGTINKGVPDKDAALPIQFHVALNRPGKFTLELKATDTLANKTWSQSFPLTVHSVK